MPTPRLSRSLVLARAPRSRMLFWSLRCMVVGLAMIGLLLIAEVLGIVSLGSGSRWEALGALAVLAWGVGWFGFVFVLQLELTEDGQLRWRKAFWSGQLPLTELDRITPLPLPFLHVVHHERGRLLGFVTDARSFREKVERQRAEH